MINAFANITFLYPAILAALLALPLLWYLLRVTPPAPKRIFFPATRFLIGLIPQDHTPSKTPWWILLLRLLMAALVIIALARPVINPADTLPGKEAVRLVIDNSWAAAQTWDLQMAEADEKIAQADRQNRDIYILTTAPVIGEKKPLHQGPFTHSQASSILRGLTPLPWPSDYKAVTELLENIPDQKNIHSFWFSHGLDEGGIYNLVQSLQKQGGVEMIIPPPEKLPLLLRPATIRSKATDEKQVQSDIYIDVDATPLVPNNLTASVQAQGKGGDILDIQSITLNNKNLPKTITFDIMEALKGDLSQFRISERKGSGAVFLLDDQSKKRDIGIVAAPEQSESAPLIDDSYYIKRALEPYGNITLGNITELIAKKVSIIVMSDISAMPADTLNSLEQWVKDGGLLLRFSGPNMAENQGEQFLLPVTLRSGGRSLAGTMTWEKPQTISPFAQTSPFFGLDVPPELTVKQQILADPSQDLSGKVWAQLTDGTPLITAAPVEKGLIVLIHTTAGPAWSDLALSGLYVNILRRISTLAGKSYASQIAASSSTLDPILIMDGFGTLAPPSPSILPLPVKDAEKTIPSSQHPPGLYGRGGVQYALNLGTALPALKTMPQLPSGVAQRYYETEYEFDLMPSLLYAAMMLFFADWLVMILITGYFGKIMKRSAFAVMIVISLLFPQNAYADSKDDILYAGGLYLAYIQTGDPAIDKVSEQGLHNLADVLKQRTSVEPDGVVALDPSKDNLAFFPIVYWAVGENQKSISGDALKNIQYYLDHGGTILFDTRDQNSSKSGIMNTPGAIALRQITASLNIPPLAPIADNHVLSQSFYLLKSFPGRFERGTVWIEQESENGRDGVSSVIIGSNDWAGAWASYAEGNRYNPVATASQQEMSMRFGVNLVMYALTGNYKADQVHIPYILERLGK